MDVLFVDISNLYMLLVLLHYCSHFAVWDLVIFRYAMTGQINQKSDVYSFGVILLELLTGRKPVDHTMPKGQQSLVTWVSYLITFR